MHGASSLQAIVMHCFWFRALDIKPLGLFRKINYISNEIHNVSQTFYNSTRSFLWFCRNNANIDGDVITIFPSTYSTHLIEIAMPQFYYFISLNRQHSRFIYTRNQRKWQKRANKFLYRLDLSTPCSFCTFFSYSVFHQLCSVLLMANVIPKLRMSKTFRTGNH